MAQHEVVKLREGLPERPGMDHALLGVCVDDDAFMRHHHLDGRQVFE